MISFSNEHKNILRAMGIAVVYLFGSRAFGTERADSDYDIGVVFEEPGMVTNRQLEVLNKLYSIFSDYLPDQLGGAHPDISLLQFANAALEMSAIDGIVLFEADPRYRVEYEEGVIERYDEYRHLQSFYEDATFTAFAAS